MTTINIKVAILNTGLRITCVPLSPNAAETVLSVILPYLMFRVAFMSLGEVVLCRRGSLV